MIHDYITERDRMRNHFKREYQCFFTSPKLKKLHLGCREKKIHGYVNIDIRPEVEPDLVEDCFKLPSFQDNSVDVIYTCHMLEHCPREQYKKVLKRWFDILKPNGVLRISVPDLTALSKYLLDKSSSSSAVKEVTNLIFGAQKHPYDYHYQGFTFNSLTSDLCEIGFSQVIQYDWRKTEHFYVDDYSHCYLPAISYSTRRPEGIIGGELMSLNVQAFK